MSRYTTVVTSGSTTQVKKVVVGTPVKRVTSGAFSINNLGGINTTGADDGHVLVFNGTTQIWESTIDLEKQNINGGSY